MESVIPKPEPRAYKLLHEGALALTRATRNGMMVNVPYIEDTLQGLEDEEAEILDALESSKLGEAWKARFRGKTNFNSDEQLADILFRRMEFDAPAYTENNVPATDAAALKSLGYPPLDLVLKLRKVKKTGGTYLSKILREQVDSVLRPFFNLHCVRSYRSSSDSPNFQNMPIRDPIMGEAVRRAIRPRPGRRLIELDYSGLEVRIAACYHKDPIMIDYLKTGYDIHREMAARLFLLEPDQVDRTTRFAGKSGFVFAQFYGSWWRNCARSLWNMIDDLELTADDRPMKAHLQEQGITRLESRGKSYGPPRDKSSFEKTVYEVEQYMWKDTFKIYNQWREDWWKQYQKRGWFRMLSGFVCHGVFARNDVINYPVQGAAFHRLLRAFIDLTKELLKRKMGSLLIGQIHDSIVADVPEHETEKFLTLAKDVMSKSPGPDWDWITVPLEAEASLSEVDGNWYEMKEDES